MKSGDHKAFITIANNVAGKSSCIRRDVGAILVREGKVLATGWNGVSGEYKDCREAGCPRCINGGETGSSYEECICIHAEQHAIADAARRGVSTQDSTLYVNLRPCLQCMAIAKASGVREIFYSEDWTVPAKIERAYRILSDQFDSFVRISETNGSDPTKGHSETECAGSECNPPL
jgi:dCMP deaminase